MLTGEEDSRVCEDVEVEEMDGGGGEKEEVKKLANEEAWKGDVLKAIIIRFLHVVVIVCVFVY